MRVGEKKSYYVAQERAHLSRAMKRRERWEINESGKASDSILRVSAGDPKLPA